MKFDKFSRKLFPRIVVTEVKLIPIPDINIEQQTKLGTLVQQLIHEMKDNSRNQKSIEFLNNVIDELVMDLFELTENEKQSIRDFQV